MRRLATIFLSVLTLLLCGGLLVLWALSYRHELTHQWGDASRLTCERGRILLQSPRRSDANPNLSIPALSDNGLVQLGFIWQRRASIPTNIPLPICFAQKADIDGDGIPDFNSLLNRNPPLFVSGFMSSGSSGTVFSVLGWQVGAPTWFLILVLAPLPAGWLMRTRRQSKRLREGCCLACGYDLRASNDRCPECGVVVPALAKPRAAL